MSKPHDADELVAMLQTLRDLERESPAAKELEIKIVNLIYDRLNDDIRRMLRDRYGADMDGRYASRRFTELFSQFYLNVRKKFPGGLLDLDARKALVTYVATSMANLLKNHCKQEGGRRDILAKLQEERETEIQADCPGVQLQAVLSQLELWDGGGELQRRWAAVIRYRYVLGMTDDQIEKQISTKPIPFEKVGEKMGHSASTAERLCKQALNALREILVD